MEGMLKRLGLYRSWWATWGTFPISSWIKAAELYSEGKFDLAELYYKKGLKKHSYHPAHVGARLDLAYCQFRAKNYKEAEKGLRQVISYAPKMRDAYLRLAKLQSWAGQPLEAGWTIRKALKTLEPDGDLVGTLLLSILENGGPSYLLEEASALTEALPESESMNPKVQIARARLAVYRGDYDDGKRKLVEVVSKAHPPVEALVLLAEMLLQENKIAYARQQLRRALVLAPEFPRTHSLLAISYLKSGLFYNPEYARQLSVVACQNSGWLSPREMHVLAEAYYHSGDKEGALLVANKAKQVGTRLFGSYRQVRLLDKLIDSISGTQA